MIFEVSSRQTILWYRGGTSPKGFKGKKKHLWLNYSFPWWHSIAAQHRVMGCLCSPWQGAGVVEEEAFSPPSSGALYARLGHGGFAVARSAWPQEPWFFCVCSCFLSISLQLIQLPALLASHCRRHLCASRHWRNLNTTKHEAESPERASLLCAQLSDIKIPPCMLCPLKCYP